MLDEEITLGCLWIGEDDRDFILDEGDIDLLPKLYKQDEIRYERNQANQDWSTVSCTIFAAMWMLADLFNIPFTLDDIKEVDELSYTTTKYPTRIRWRWRRVRYAVWLTADWYNSSEYAKKYGKVAYYRMNKHSIMVEEALKNLYTLDTNFCPTSAYSADYRKDAMLDWTDFWTATNWHSVDIISKEWQRGVKDSYKGRKTYDWKKDCNFYGLKHELKDISNYGERLYIYTKVSEDNFEEVKRLNSIKSESLVAIDHLGKIYNLVNDTELQADLHRTADKLRAKIDTCNEMLKKLV